MRNIVVILMLYSNITFASLPLKVVDNFIPEKYLGLWYEIARLPMFFERNCYASITATYSLDQDNPEKILVKNSCYEKDGELNTANGVAEFIQNTKTAKLSVSFLPRFMQWLPFTRGDYWVLYTDYEQYSLVGTPNRDYLWILSRSEKVDVDKINNLIQIAKQQGFNTKALIVNYPSIVLKKS